jgi:dTDP-4-amino-4,6-dideoxygalactose transaminase
VQIPFFSLQAVQDRVRETLIPRINNVIDGKEFILGSAVRDFENEYALYSNTQFCVGVANGLDALKICLRCLEIGKSDEVIVPANTYIATILAVLEVGAIPVLVEPDKAVYNINAKGIEPFITSKTKAIMPVHLYGQACDMDGIEKLAQRHKLYVIEDNAQAQGAGFNGRLTGSIGQINATSFYPSKNLGAMGDAGGITTNDNQLAERARLLRNVGSVQKYHHQLTGYNSRLDTLQAAILSCKLPYLNEWNAERKQIAARYAHNLKDCERVILPVLADDAEHVYHLYVIRHAQRDKLQQYLLQQGIQTLIHYPVPPHLQPALANLGYKQGAFPVTEEISRTCLSLPLFIGITNEQIDFVSEKIMSFEKDFSR